ncbi:MAG TPA: hypothetical protein VIG24_07465 [Acidimicrobiia bacterium]
MSVTRITYVHCDGCGANANVDAGDTGATATEIRQEARTDGQWAVSLPGGRDLCPNCRPDQHSPYGDECWNCRRLMSEHTTKNGALMCPTDQ